MRAKMTEEEKKAKQKAAEDRAALARCKCGKSEDFEPIVWRVETVPEARVRDRFQHNRCFNTLKSGMNKESKTFWFDIVCAGIPDHKIVTFTFDEICKEFGWKKFDLELNDQTIRPTWLKSSI